MFKRVTSFLFKGSLIIVITLLLFEGAFRLYLIDFYSYSISPLNEGFKRSESADDLLLIGDSFSAFIEGYASFLNDNLDSLNVYNASVAGTNIREQYLFGKSSLRQLDPEVVIFQFYVGNDLFAWDHPVNWSEISILRNVYWKLSEHLWSLTYINHRLSVLGSSGKGQLTEDFFTKEFSTESYSKRDRLYFKAEPALVENSVYLKLGREKHMEAILKRLNKLFAEIAPNSRIYLLIIPHAAQVNERYYERTRQLGAQFSSEFIVGAIDSPLINRFESFFEDDPRVNVLNPIGFLKAREEEGHRTYFNNDSHLSFEGQHLLGQYLLENVIQGAKTDQ